jgi:hypothetical protein
MVLEFHDLGFGFPRFTIKKIQNLGFKAIGSWDLHSTI